MDNQFHQEITPETIAKINKNIYCYCIRIDDAILFLFILLLITNIYNIILNYRLLSK